MILNMSKYPRVPILLFGYGSLKFAWISILAQKALFIYDVIIFCLKAWYLLFTNENIYKRNFCYLHNGYISVNCSW